MRSGDSSRSRIPLPPLSWSQHGGVLRTGQALIRGTHPAALYSLVESGQLTRLARGLYRLADAQEFSNFHGITTQVPRAVYLAVSRGRYAGLRLRTPPVKIYRFDAATFDQGIETHRIDGVTVRIYGVARTLVDCFKYRNKLGLDIAIEALRFARERKRTSNREILHFASLLRQVRVIGPYLESMT